MIVKNSFSVSGLIVQSVSFAIALMTFTAYAQSPSHNMDPLSFDELSTASLLTAGPRLAARGVNTDVSSLTNNNREVLLIERNEEKGAPSDQRRADVFIYDYSRNELIQSLVDLNTSEVIRSERKQGVQLPLTDKELIRAKHIVFGDEEERAILEDEFRRITSRELSDIADLNIKAFTFHADSLPNRVNEASKQCGIHRCAQLMLYTQENVVFEISPIVNLSAGVVTQRIGF
ncbi:MAG: hypothetical protein V7749_03495 [Cocleimonas sp.]